MSKEKLIVLLLLVTFFGGVTSTLTKGVVTVVPPVLFASLRFFIAFAVVLVVFRKQIISQFKREHVKPILFIAVLMSGGFVFFNRGLSHTTATNASFFYTLSTLMIPFLAKWINGIKFYKGLLFGLCIAMIGMYFLATNGGSFSLNSGDWLTLISALFFALQVVYTGRYTHIIAPAVLACLQFCFVGIFTLTISLLTGESLSLATFGLKEWGAIAFAGILGTGLLYITQTFAQVKLKESTIGIVYAFVPVFTAASAWVLLGERLSLIGILGGALMISGIILAGKLNVPHT